MDLKIYSLAYGFIFFVISISGDILFFVISISGDFLFFVISISLETYCTSELADAVVVQEAYGFLFFVISISGGVLYLRTRRCGSDAGSRWRRGR
jgi:hypothetical protein